MSAPVRTRGPAPSAGGRRTTRQQGTGRVRSTAAQRAYARRAQRSGRPAAAPSPDADGRTRFVVLVMVLLAGGLIATLALSTSAAADSYRVQQAQSRVRQLSERAEALSRTVANLQTPPSLARRARALGMVPATEPARLVVRPGGEVAVIGHPAPVPAPAPPPEPDEPDGPVDEHRTGPAR